jgi:hypothetical protein
MSQAFTLVIFFIYSLVCEGTTTTSTITSLPALLTGNCTAATTTWAALTSYTPTLGSTTNLVNGQLLQSLYSTSSPDATFYTFFTLGCQLQSASLSCCPSEALSTGTDTVAGTTFYSIEPLTACPSDYFTTIDQGYTVDADNILQTRSPTTLCCPSSWELWIWPTPFANSDDPKPCYQPWPPNTTINPGNPDVVWETGPSGQPTEVQVTPDYNVAGSLLYTGVTDVTLGVRMTGSYKLRKPGSGGKNKLGTGATVGISVAVPLTCLFIGVALLYRLHKSRERRREERKKKDETEKGPGMPEMGEGLRHELEPGTQMATSGRTETGAEEVEGTHIGEMQDAPVATLRSPWSDGPLHELPGNTPAAHEVVAEDWRIVP